MSWLYEQATGHLITPAGEVLSPPGYSGAFGIWLNNPVYQNVKDKGCIPEGWYTRGEPVAMDLKTGRYSIPLTPDADNEMFGRDDFRMHGDSILEPGHASEGCIIQTFEVRKQFGESPDSLLHVVPGY